VVRAHRHQQRLDPTHRQCAHGPRLSSQLRIPFVGLARAMCLRQLVEAAAGVDLPAAGQSQGRSAASAPTFGRTKLEQAQGSGWQ